jgi:hypothetical protein
MVDILLDDLKRSGALLLRHHGRAVPWQHCERRRIERPKRIQ